VWADSSSVSLLVWSPADLTSSLATELGVRSLPNSAIILSMKQIITRIDDDLAVALKKRAAESGESVNSYISRLLRVAVAGPNSPRQVWKAAAIANGIVMARPARRHETRKSGKNLKTAVTTPAGFAAGLVSMERDER
jgi:plasmid stability protein